MKTIADKDLRTLIDSLKDHKSSLLVIDTKLCPHSRRLLDEIEVATCLQPSTSDTPQILHLLDLGSHFPASAADTLTWLPGVPCLLAANQVHLGVDAFAKCREFCRSVDGLRIHRLS